MNSGKQVLDLQRMNEKENSKVYGWGSWVSVVCLTIPSLISTTCL